AKQGTRDLSKRPYPIESILDYITYFGNAQPEPGIVVTIDASTTPPTATATVDPATQSKYMMYYAVQHYFANGGSMCYILSIGKYATPSVVNVADYLPDGTTFEPILEQYNDITLVVCPDALGVTDATNYYKIQNAVLTHCIKMQNRMAVMDVYR